MRARTASLVLDALRAERKGDRPGHPFRGNQHVRVGGNRDALSTSALPGIAEQMADLAGGKVHLSTTSASGTPLLIADGPALQGRVVHQTTPASAEKIAAEGFDIWSSGHGSVFGEGGYASIVDDASGARLQSRPLGGGAFSAKVEFDVRLDNPLWVLVDNDPGARLPSFDAETTARAVVGGRKLGAVKREIDQQYAKAWDDFVNDEDRGDFNESDQSATRRWMDAKGYKDIPTIYTPDLDAHERDVAATRLALKRAGYDGIVYREASYTHSKWGSQVCVFDGDSLTTGEAKSESEALHLVTLGEMFEAFRDEGTKGDRPGHPFRGNQHVRVASAPDPLAALVSPSPEVVRAQAERAERWLLDEMAGSGGIEYGEADDGDVTFTFDNGTTVKRSEMVDTVRSMLEDFADDEASVLVSYWNAPLIMESGRFKNQHETDTSGGTLNPEARKRTEERMGATEDALDDPKLLPIYGATTQRIEREPIASWQTEFDMEMNNRFGAAQDYGSIGFVLGEGARSRATFTLGDSLGRYTGGSPKDGSDRDGPIPVPLDPRKVRALSDDAVLATISEYGTKFVARAIIDRAEGVAGALERRKADLTRDTYGEVQVWGGLKMRDIVRIDVFDNSGTDPAPRTVIDIANRHGLAVQHFEADKLNHRVEEALGVKAEPTRKTILVAVDGPASAYADTDVLDLDTEIDVVLDGEVVYTAPLGVVLKHGYWQAPSTESKGDKPGHVFRGNQHVRVATSGAFTDSNGKEFDQWAMASFKDAVSAMIGNRAQRLGLERPLTKAQVRKIASEMEPLITGSTADGAFAEAVRRFSIEEQRRYADQKRYERSLKESKPPLATLVDPAAEKRRTTDLESALDDLFDEVARDGKLGFDYDPYDESPGSMTWKQARDRFVAELQTHLEDRIAASDVWMRVPMTALDDLLETGRFETLHASMLNPSIADTSIADHGGASIAERRKLEDEFFGKNRHPTYGYLSDGGSGFQQGDGRGYSLGDASAALSSYSDSVAIRFLPHVKDRTTFTWGDSMGSDGLLVPQRMKNPTLLAVGDQDIRGATTASPWPAPYVESQIHGRLTLDDIDYVEFNGTPHPTTATRLARMGVRFRVASPDVRPWVMPALSAPQAELEDVKDDDIGDWLAKTLDTKGEGAGHPFRGNQHVRVGVSAGAGGGAIIATPTEPVALEDDDWGDPTPTAKAWDRWIGTHAGSQKISEAADDLLSGRGGDTPAHDEARLLLEALKSPHGTPDSPTAPYKRVEQRTYHGTTADQWEGSMPDVGDTVDISMLAVTSTRRDAEGYAQVNGQYGMRNARPMLIELRDTPTYGTNAEAITSGRFERVEPHAGSNVSVALRWVGWIDELPETKGDRPGHAFRGNQHVRVGGGTERGRKLRATLDRPSLPSEGASDWPSKDAVAQRSTETLAALNEIEGGAALIDAVSTWKTESWEVDSLQEAAETLANGGTPNDVPAGERARSLLTAISDMPSTSPELLRGLSIQSDTTSQADLLADMVEKFKVGETVDLGLSSFTTDAKTAETFGEAAGGVSIILKTKGAKALPVENMMTEPYYAREREWITAGRFKVEQVEQVESWIEYDGGRVEMVPRLNVTVSQVAVPKIEGQA